MIKSLLKQMMDEARNIMYSMSEKDFGAFH